MALKYIEPNSAGRFNCLVIGRAGIGKTSLLRTIPEDEPACTLSCESGLLAVKDLVDSGRVQGVVIEDFQDFLEAYDCLANNQDWKNAYKWIFVDSLSEVASMAVEVSQEKHASAKDTFKMWGEYSDSMIRLVKGFRDLTSYNVVFTALETLDLDDMKRRIIAPDMPGKKLKERLPSMFDEVFYMSEIADEHGAPRRVLHTTAVSGYPAKDRSGKLAAIEEPNLAEIKAKILGAQS
jgi:hypothetical protein